jgi:diguanylate cyclase
MGLEITTLNAAAFALVAAGTAAASLATHVRDRAKLRKLEKSLAKVESDARAGSVYRREVFRSGNKQFISLDDSLDDSLRLVLETLRVDRVSLWTFQRGRQAIALSHFADVDPAATQGPTVINASDCPSYFVALKENLVVAAEDAETDPRTLELREGYLRQTGVRAILDVPVRSMGNQIGVICCEVRLSSRAWSQQDQNFAAAIAQQISLAFERDELLQTQQSLVRRTLLDPATQLPNRLCLVDALNQEAERLVEQTNTRLSLIVVDINRFNALQETLGNEAAEKVLVVFAKRLQALVPANLVIARIGSDEFAVISTEPVHEFGVIQLAKSLNQSVSKPYSIAGREFFLTLSIGITHRMSDTQALPAQTSEDMLREAGAAVGRSRMLGQPVVYSPDIQRDSLALLSLEREVRGAAQEHQFVNVLQPIVDLQTGEIVAFEALMRWNHPTRGVVSPGEFIDILVNTGCLVDVGHQVLQLAVENFAQLLRRCPSLANAKLNVNMAGCELLADGSVERCLEALAKHNLKPEQLAIELTETTLINELDRAHAILRRFKDAGVTLCLDDFGTGYSSLLHLRDMPIDCLKLESAFSRHIATRVRDHAIVTGLVSLSIQLQQTVVAEGLESVQELQALRRIGVRYGQGFLFSAGVTSATIDNSWANAVRERVLATLNSNVTA